MLHTYRHVRSFGVVAPILILYLRALGISERLVGLFLSLTLLGDVLLSLGVTWTADHIGRRRMLALGSVLMGGAGVSLPAAAPNLSTVSESGIANSLELIACTRTLDCVLLLGILRRSPTRRRLWNHLSVRERDRSVRRVGAVDDVATHDTGRPGIALDVVPSLGVRGRSHGQCPSWYYR